MPATVEIATETPHAHYDQFLARFEALHADAQRAEAAIRELDAATRRVDNAALVATLPDLDIPAATIVEQLESERR